MVVSSIGGLFLLIIPEVDTISAVVDTISAVWLLISVSASGSEVSMIVVVGVVVDDSIGGLEGGWVRGGRGRMGGFAVGITVLSTVTGNDVVVTTVGF